MKISLLSNTSHTVPPQGWGGEILVWDLYECLKKLGHDISLFAPKGSKELSYEIPLDETNIIKNDIEIYNKYKDIFQSSDIVHDISHIKITSDSLYYNGYKNFISTLFGYYWKYPKCGLNITVPSQTMRLHGILGCNGFENSPWQDMMGKDVGKLNNAKAVLLGTNTDFYLPKYEKDDYFLWLNGFTEWKGLGLTINLAMQMKFNLVISGSVDGNQEQIQLFKHYNNLIKDYPNIKYIPLPKDETHHFIKRELMQNAKAFIFPILRDEGFGLTTIEALSCGTPIIATNRGAMPEIINHNKTGFCCDTIEDIVHAIQNIDNIKPSDCRESAVKQFDRMIMTKKYEKLYKDIINGNSW